MNCIDDAATDFDQVWLAKQAKDALSLNSGLSRDLCLKTLTGFPESLNYLPRSQDASLWVGFVVKNYYVYPVKQDIAKTIYVVFHCFYFDWYVHSGIDIQDRCYMLL